METSGENSTSPPFKEQARSREAGFGPQLWRGWGGGSSAKEKSDD